MANRKKDIIAYTGRGDGDSLEVIRWTEKGTEVGKARPIKEGKPIDPSSEMIQLNRIENTPFYEVETLHGGKSGPSQVASDSYRTNWSKTFKKSKSQLN